MNPYKNLFVSTLIIIGFIFLSAYMHSNDKGTGALFRRALNFNDDWKFKRCEPSENTLETFKEIAYDDAAWETVILPHTPRIEPLVVNDQWQGICWYRKKFAMGDVYRDKKIFVEFEAAMQIAEVWVNGNHKTTHYGGYLPFTIDITADVFFDKKNLIAVRLDNRDNSEVPPGKALKDLDFCMYGGLYRNAKMHITDKLHITDAVYANKVAGGGVFVRYPVVKNEHAQIWVQTHVINESDAQKKLKIVTRLFDGNKLAAEKSSDFEGFASLEDKHLVQTIDVQRPKLWHPNSPHLYALHSIIFQDA
jgi:beta-galactosidase